MNTPKIHEIIRAKRRERDLTQEELANILGVTKAAVSKWETAESYPDITMLPQIAQLFHITMDELFGYTLELQPLKIVNEYRAGFKLSALEDLSLLDHGTVKECKLEKYLYYIGDTTESRWEVTVCFISNENDFPYTVQKYIRSGNLIDMVSYRLADGKIVEDDKPTKHYVCKDKVWEYRLPNPKFVREMIKEQIAMGLIDEEDAF
ncbi:MAG: helix-turn-helix transcriptional regulator [Clostridia bacterium]|nr:helix-turn-helix transcriptional regulator [Clostridia bacterium]